VWKIIINRHRLLPNRWCSSSSSFFFFIIGCRRQWCNITTTTLVFTSLENRLPKAQYDNANVWINKRQKKEDAKIYAWLNGKSFYTYVFCDSRWSIHVSFSNFSVSTTQNHLLPYGLFIFLIGSDWSDVVVTIVIDQTEIYRQRPAW